MAYTHDRGGDNYDSYRPRYQRNDKPPPQSPGMFHFHGAAGDRSRRNGDNRSDFNFRSKTKISERPLLRARRGSQEEKVLGDAVDGAGKFRNIDELTDSDEAEMEDSEDEQEDKPANKRARLEPDQDEKPKWSNPDVYTSLPAPSETSGKKLDFVKLIRKARNSDMKSNDLMANDEDFISFDKSDNEDAAPPNAPTGPRIPQTDMTLGKRKRGETSGSKLISRRGAYFYQDGMVLDEWRAKDSVHPTPWLQLHANDPVGLAFHKEILDFHEWVKPRDYEFQVRSGVIDRISAALNRIEAGELKAFGSYAAGLYLPTGDMDLVYMPRGFNQRRAFSDGISVNQFRKYGDFLRKSGIAQANSLTMIPKAKVPIIKFIEKVSGLKVDLSFNNDTGVVAIDTFQKWKDQHPAMPILVSVVKQFLMIRGLNDVSVGGLGGFSIICLVTSLLQHIPTSAAPPHLGDLLTEFFNLYGNLLDRHNVGIRMEPPGYLNKVSYMQYTGNLKDKAGRLMIIDPNRADNNISGGTHEIETIFDCFSRAHEVLQNRLVDYQSYDPSSGHGFSFLEDLVGGDFRAYQVQRDILYGLHFGRNGPAPAVVPPPPPPLSTRETVPPPPPPSTREKPKSSQTKGSKAKAPQLNGSSTAQTTRSKKSTKAERRALRLKTLRPELAPLIGSKISVQEAVQVGKYQDYNEMGKDLDQRETELNA